MAWKILRRDAIDAFKRRWPAHGLPDDLESLACDFASNGDLVDLEAYAVGADGSDIRLDTHEFDGAALRALTEDCAEFGDDC